MSRPAGARNADYAETKARLAARLAERLLASGGPEASLRELAAAADVSVPTLRHYFEDRSGAIAAALASIGAAGAPWMAHTRDPGPGDARASLQAWGQLFVVGWRQAGVGRMQQAGLAAGLGESALGPAYLEALLEPVQQALEGRVEALQARGDLREGPPRLAALQLLAPMVLALLHQDALGGSRCRPLDVDPFVPAHIDAWLRAWGVERAAT